MSVIPASPEAELRLLDPLELAEQIVSLASKALAGGDKRGADTLGHWYVFFPLFCAIEGWDDANAPEPERIQALLRLLDVPEARLKWQHLTAMSWMSIMKKRKCLSLSVGSSHIANG